MATNFLLRSYVSGKLYTERWASWDDAKRAKKRLESVGHKVTIGWLDLDANLIDVTDNEFNPDK